MQRSHLVAFAAGLAAAGSGFFVTGFGPDHGDHKHHDHDHHKHAADAPAMSPEEEMEAYMASIMPGDHHAELAKAAGTWDAVTSFMMEPGAPPVAGVGTMECEMVLGGRYLQGRFHMDDMMGVPFDGLSFAGYDNIREEYVTTWMDTFGTGIMYMTGHMHENGKMEMVGASAMPSGDRHMKIVSEWDGDDQFTDTFYDKQPDGSWMKSGHIKYTRR
ncbi:MAG: DUF1579 family protein [Planctomycetota bacterium]